MEILTEYPPNIEQIKTRFNLEGTKPIFAWGNIIYNPHNSRITPDLFVHEGTHQLQQNNDPQSWWDKYLQDDDFRLKQEVEAYKAQYNFFCVNFKDRNQRHKFLHQISKDLSSKMYGNIISYSGAKVAISK